MFLQKLCKQFWIVHQFENPGSAEAEARPDVESQTAVAAEAIANPPLAVIAPPQKFPPVPCSQQKDLCMHLLFCQNNPPQQPEGAKGPGAGMKPPGQGGRGRSTPSTGRRFQTLRATRLTGPQGSQAHSIVWREISGFFSKVPPDIENILRKKNNGVSQELQPFEFCFWYKERSSVMGQAKKQIEEHMKTSVLLYINFLRKTRI